MYCQVDNLVVHDKKFLDKHGIKTSKRNILSKLEITNFSPVEYQLLEQQLLLKGYSFAYLADFQDTAETRENLYQLVRQSVEDDAGLMANLKRLRNSMIESGRFTGMLEISGALLCTARVLSL